MILTITLNPAVDISYKFDHLYLDTTNRVIEVSKTAGGKGLNVSRVLNQLGEKVGASGFLGGSLGHFISSQIESHGIHNFFVDIKGETRNCIAIIHEGKQTEILESGPVISEKEAKLFLKKFTDDVQRVDMVTISGSLPKGLSHDFYGQLLTISNRYDTPVLLDVNGHLMASTLESGSSPYLIKPNEDELAECLGKTLVYDSEIVEALKSDRFRNIPWVVVTLGDKGALVKHNNNFYRVKVPKINVVNPVGSGDSVVAGFAAGISKKLQGEQLIKFGLAMGVLNAMEEKTGHINPKKIDWALDHIYVEKLND